MIEGACHCGKVRWSFDGMPDCATACNCTVCRRYGTLWAYDFENERIKVSGPTRVYRWGERRIGFHFCPDCGVVAYWRGEKPREDGPPPHRRQLEAGRARGGRRHRHRSFQWARLD